VLLQAMTNEDPHLGSSWLKGEAWATVEQLIQAHSGSGLRNLFSCLTCLCFQLPFQLQTIPCHMLDPGPPHSLPLAAHQLDRCGRARGAPSSINRHAQRVKCVNPQKCECGLECLLEAFFGFNFFFQSQISEALVRVFARIQLY
jgi:hypothetical protein